MKHGKKYVEAAKAVERFKLYDPAEAVAVVKKTAVAKFDETIEAHIRTGCDGRHADQQIRGAVVLPHGTGKKAVSYTHLLLSGTAVFSGSHVKFSLEEAVKIR